MAQLLIDATLGVRDASLGGVVREDVDSVVEAAHLHRVGPAVHRLVRRSEQVPTSWKGPLAAVERAQLMRHMLAQVDIKSVQTSLVASDIDFVVAKGPVAAEAIWPAVNMREYFDVDIFVSRPNFGPAVDALLEAGCQLVDRNWPEILRSRRAELALRGPHGTHFDLHWDIAVVPKLRRSFSVDLNEMLGRAVPVTLGSGIVVQTFEEVDTVLHFIFHTAQAGANRLMWAGDIHYAAGGPSFPWEVLEQRLAHARLSAPAALVLQRVADSLGFVESPSQQMLSSAGLWGSLIRRRERRAPFPGLPGDTRIGGVMFSSARESLARSAALALTEAIEVRGIERKTRKRQGDTPVLYRDVTDASARRAYFDYVRAGTAD